MKYGVSEQNCFSHLEHAEISSGPKMRLKRPRPRLTLAVMNNSCSGLKRLTVSVVSVITLMRFMGNPLMSALPAVCPSPMISPLDNPGAMGVREEKN